MGVHDMEQKKGLIIPKYFTKNIAPSEWPINITPLRKNGTNFLNHSAHSLY